MRFPGLQELKARVGITVTNTGAYPWLRTLSLSYQAAKLQVQGEGDWQRQFRSKRQKDATSDIQSLILRLLAQHGPLTAERLDCLIAKERGLKRRDLALIMRNLKRMAIAGQVKGMGAGRYTLAHVEVE